MTTTLDPSFLRAVVLMSSFRCNTLHSAQAALLTIGLRGATFTGADLPAELCIDKNGNPSRHICGAATGSLVAMGLLEVVGRVKSPNANAKGRRVDLLRIPANKVSTARTWLMEHGYPETKTEQLSFIA